MTRKIVCFVFLASLPLLVTPATAQDFPEGPGRETVVATCGGCHDINRLKVGYTPDGWRNVMRMMQNMEAPVPKEQWTTVTDYLIKSLPERARPAAVILPGPIEARIKVWQVPTEGSRPHDPLATRDGALWWTGQLSNRLGRLDPKTGEMKEFTLKSPHTGPHGLTEDGQGNIWFTGNSLGLIGKFDPRTGKTTEYDLKDPAAKDPHTLIFDRNGILWFTVQQANMLGPARSSEWCDQARNIANGEVTALRNGVEFQKRGVLRRFRYQQDRHRRCGDHADQGIQPAECGRPAAAHRDLAGRHDLVHGFRARVHRPSRFRNWRGQGMAFAVGSKVRTLCDRFHQGRALVQRDGGEAQRHLSASIPRPSHSNRGRSRAVVTSSATWT